ncbi:MAG: DUF934 domain-containing protein [Pseudomonadota bacterium]|nr:DUF934 domain-containing protein [Pseudomonadota bacterium]
MALIIDRKPVTEDRWQWPAQAQPLPAAGPVVLPLARWLEQADALIGRESGVLVNGDDDLEQILALKERVRLVAIEFPTFADGRGFSIARLLRRAGFSGEIRAIGDVTRDRLAFLERCGFNALQVPDERYRPEILAAFDEISVRYQGDANQPRPAYPQS